MTGAEDIDKRPTEPALIVKGGPTDGYVFPLNEGMSILVGSGRLATLRVGTDEVGSAHIRVTWDENGISVTDNGSITGTFVNGEQIETAVLWDGDHIAFTPPGTKKHLPKLLVRIPPGTVKAPPPPPPEPAVVLTAPPPPDAPPAPARPQPVRGRVARNQGFAVPRISLPSLPSLPRPDLSRIDPKLVGAIGGGLALLVVLALLVQRFLFSTPVVTAIQPEGAQPGQTVTVSGKRFDPDPARNTVWFGDKSVPANASTGTTLAVVVPDAPAEGGTLQVAVETPRGRSKPLSFQINTPLRVTGFEPEAAMPGDEVTARGQGFAEGPAKVIVGDKDAVVVEARRDGLRFKMPHVTGELGGTVPVMVRAGNETARPVDIVLGRLPIVTEVLPARASPGDRVTIRGRGFAADPAGNVVTIAGTPALVLSASPRELQILAPAAGGDRVVTEGEVVVRAGGKASTNRAVLGVARQAMGAFMLRFFAAAVGEAAGPQLFASTDVGPLLLLASPAGAASGAERAIKTAAALNSAFDRARGGQVVVFEARGEGVGLRGSPDLVVQATAEDAAAYGAPPGFGNRRAPAPSALADFWAALLNDYVSLFVTNEKPVRVLGLTPRGKALVDLRSAMGWQPGGALSAQRVAALGPEILGRLRETALLVPEGGQAPTPGVALAALEGYWEGEMQETGSGSRPITVQLRIQGAKLEGTLTNRTSALAMDVALRDVAFERGTLRFVLPVGTAARTFVGTVDGGSVAGTIHASTSGPAIGRFSLKNVP